MKVINNRYEEECKLSKLTPHPQNPRQADEEAIAGSIDDSGFYGAVIAQLSTGYILVGNNRYKVAKRDKAETIPVIWIDVDDARALKILLADNRTSDLAEYKPEELISLLEKVRVDSGLIGTGWSEEDYSAMLRKSVEETPRPLIEYTEEKAETTTKLECPKCHHKWKSRKAK